MPNKPHLLDVALLAENLLGLLAEALHLVLGQLLAFHQLRKYKNRFKFNPT
jgi:hypothetical protein